MIDKVKQLEVSELENYLTSVSYYRNEIIDHFGENPDYSKLTIREKIYPGMYFQPLIITDSLTTKRWEFWSEVLYTGNLLKDIPQVDFMTNRGLEHEKVFKMLKNCIEISGVSRHKSFTDFVQYILYCLKPLNYYEGTKKEKLEKANKLISRIDDIALKHYYEIFSLEAMLLYPGDYLGDLAAEYLGSNGSEYYPTPNHIVEIMTKILMNDSKDKFNSVCDPCCGSSRMLLFASNNSLRVMGMDVNSDIINVSIVNSFLYVPWAVCNTKEIDNMINSVVNIDNVELDAIS